MSTQENESTRPLAEPSRKGRLTSDIGELLNDIELLTAKQIREDLASEDEDTRRAALSHAIRLLKENGRVLRLRPRAMPTASPDGRPAAAPRPTAEVPFPAAPKPLAEDKREAGGE